ncbi:capsule biosynthesis GfcC family protein [Stenotrophomonas sp. SY1]|uniref:capsule biosynthesis GfcC family protein n=1 Tax=Stenotrophomonas sp. SY1 TaxID=477235 RepID=UPI001E52B3EA|nr:capsule biosynthesis GfcC family protein [Stenotrophomonas sp. SY1]MCD9086652.1 capsule biosynthesis GfcC family protein [Stenotrophomonas sp. SY1]
MWLLTCAQVQAQTHITIEASGSVHAPGLHVLPARARLSAAADTARPTTDAYHLGAALLRHRELPEQARHKAGLMFDLGLLSTGGSDMPALAEAADQLIEILSPMPVTGRVMQLLEPRTLEANRTQDYPASTGDHLFYPSRPTTVTVTGAVRNACKLPHVPLQTPAAYRQQCPLLRAASRDYLHVIQPDGSIERLGIALWNRSPRSTLAPGALIYVPLDDSLSPTVAPNVNDAAAKFLATQVLGASGVQP